MGLSDGLIGSAIAKHKDNKAEAAERPPERGQHEH